MARRSLPESLELLLDTMCNTFGGVMFIAISMVITLMLSQDMLTPQKRQEEEKRQLEECKRENQRLEERIGELEKRLAKLKEEAGKETPTEGAALSAAVAKLEQELNDLTRKRERLAGDIRILDTQSKQLKSDNDRQEEELEKKSRESIERKEKLDNENQRLTDELAALRGTLANTPVKTINFARNERTSKSPYILIVKNDRLYRAGPWLSLQDTPDVSVKRSGSAVFLTPRRGEPLASVDRNRFARICRDFSLNSHFLWIMVDDGSLAAFVPFRRMLRSMGCQIFWYVNRNNIIYTGGNGYSAAD